MAGETTVAQTYRVTLERRKELKKWAAERGTSVQAMIDEGLEIVLNRASDSTVIDLEKNGGKKEIALQIRDHLVHTGRQDPRWGDLAFLVVDCDVEWIATNLAQIILGHLTSLELAQRTGVPYVVDEHAPDYAAGVDECKKALEQLLRYFETRRKKARRTPEARNS